MPNNPAIVIVAYNRTDTLQRLLLSVANAVYTSPNITLIISIDYSNTNSAVQLCEEFDWQHGEKKIIKHTVNIGLKQHIMQCCALSMQYGAVIILEDDLIVSPYYYTYAQQALQPYKEDPAIAGISLYSYAVTENGFLPFYPLADGNGTYFMQLPSSWGQLFTAAQWKGFEDWYKDNTQIPINNNLPEYVNAWGEKSWKKHFIHYMIENDKYFVFPKISYTTNSGEPGTNTDRKGLYQVQLAQAYTSVSNINIGECNAVYDAWFEMLPEKLSALNPKLSELNYTVDLYGSKSLKKINTPYLLSSKPCSNPVETFGNELPDTVQNIAFQMKGSFFNLGKTDLFKEANIDPLSFYTNLYPIIDVVAEKYIVSKFTSYVKDKEYKEQYPIINFIVLQNSASHTSETVDSIKKINYPADRISTRLMQHLSCESLSLSNSNEIFVLLEDGEVIDKDIVKEAVAVLRKYPDVNWLTFASEKSAPLQRWNKHLFQLSRSRKSLRRINNAVTFFNMQAWNNIAGKHFEALDLVWLMLFDTQQLYVCINNDIAVPETQPVLMEKNLWNSIWEQFMVSNTPYLRAYYKNKHGLVPIIRQTTDGAYYMSDY